MTELLILATEGVEGIPGDHIAAKLALPLGILIFCGSVYMLLWSNYGAKKGALIYSASFFGFTTMLGIFWWFGAPGTPIATGLQNFPGQAPDAYQGQWYPFEQGSARADFFPKSNAFSNFQSVAEYIGASPDADLDGDPRASFISGDLEQGVGQMTNLYLPRDDQGGLEIGANRRQALQEAAGEPRENEVRADPFYTVEVIDEGLVDDGGTRLAAAEYRIIATFRNTQTDETREVEIVEDNNVMFAFKDPGAIWFPSAVWTGISFLLFAGSLFGLDRIEQREKREQAQVQEPEDVAVPVAQ